MRLMLGLFWLLPLALVVWAAARVGGGVYTPVGAASPAPDILERRYAGGEIGAEEFEQARRALG